MVSTRTYHHVLTMVVSACRDVAHVLTMVVSACRDVAHVLTMVVSAPRPYYVLLCYYYVLILTMPKTANEANMVSAPLRLLTLSSWVGSRYSRQSRHSRHSR